MVNKRKFLSILIIKGYKLDDVAAHLGITTQTLRNKLNGKSEFYVSEAYKISKFLELTDMSEIFFADEAE